MAASGICCPKCEDSELEPVRMQRDLEIDRCPKCDGVWLDRSEVYAFVDRPNQAYEEFKAACQGMSATSFACPRCAQPMLQVSLGELPFEACPRCGGNWFDKGEVQKLCAYLDEKWAASGQPGAGPRVTVGPRDPTARELEDWLGPDRALGQAFVFAASCVAVAAAVSESSRTLGMTAALGAVCLAGGYVWLSLRRWYLKGCRVVVGEIGHYADEVADRAEVRVLFTHEDYPYQITRIIGYRTPLDVGAGGRVLVLVNPLYPRGAFIAAPAGEADAPWSEEDRRRRMAPRSPTDHGSLRGSAVSPYFFLRLGAAALVLFGVQELLSGEAVHYEWHGVGHAGDLAPALGYYQRTELHGDLARLHGFAQAAVGLLALLLSLLGLDKALVSALRHPQRCQFGARRRTRLG